MKVKFMKKAISIVMSVCMLFSLLICFMAIPASADSSTMVVFDKSKEFSRVLYRPDTGAFEPGGKYLFSFDFDNLTANDESKCWGIFFRIAEDNYENPYFEEIPHDSYSIVKSELKNGLHYDVTFTVPTHCLAEDNILFKFGDAYSRGYEQTMRVGNLDLWKLNSSDEKEAQIPLTTPDGIGNISQVKSDKDITCIEKNNGVKGKWVGLKYYMDGISVQSQDGYFEPEISNPFGVPESTLRFYTGGKNAFAEYVDNSIDLPAGLYTLGCKYKDFGTNPEFSLYFSYDNGVSYSKASLSVTDTKKNNRMANFTLNKAANAVKIVIGNITENTDVNLAIAGLYLKNADKGEQLIEDIKESTVNRVGLGDANENKKWNIHADSDNAPAVELIPYNGDYFLPEYKAMTYQNVAGKQYSYALYKNAAFTAAAGKEYIVMADYKVLSGSFVYNDVGKSRDPAFRVKVGSYILEDSNSSKFDVLTSNFDELTGKLYIRFSRKTKTTKLEIIAGNYSTSSFTGACAVGNVQICECFTKADGVTVYKDTLIDNITEDTLYKPSNGDSANAADKKWNTVYSSSAADYKTFDYSADYFKPSPAMLEINEGAKGAYISYEDSSLKLLAGKTYQFTLNTRTVFGNPEFFFGFKTVGGVTGDSYSEISRNAAFLMYFNDEFEKTTYLRTISFTPKSDISGVCIKIGNISANNVSEVAVARAALYNIDSNSIVIGDNLLASMIKQNIKRNTAEQRIWNIVSAKEEDVAITVPADEMMFTLEKMIKIEPNNSWNRVQYYDTSFKLSANTTYRYTADFISFGGNPSFSCTYLDNNTQEYRKFSTISSSYTDLSDSETNIRGFEFTTKNLSSEELANIGELSINVGNSTEAVDVDCVFANPRFYVIKDGKPVGENLVTPITEDTVQYMGTMSYDAVWNLRYQSSSAIKLLDIPDNYFRIPAFVIKNANATVSQTVTVKPDTYYKYSYYVKTAAGAVDTYIKSISPDGTQSDVKTENVNLDADGYYSYSGEFKTPASLKAENNLRVGFSFDNSADGAVSNFQLYELNSGFEKTGANLIADGNFTEIKTVPAYTGADQIGWTLEGTEGDAGISARASGYFAIPTPKVFIFAGGSAGNALSHTATLEKDKTYTLSFNLKYANPGYEGDTGVDIAYSPDGSVWKVLDCEDVSPTNEFKKVYNFTMPADAGNAVNFKFSIRAGSDYVSGYIANAVLTDTANPSENLLSNGDFSNGLIGWNTTASFKCTFFADIPDGYFSNPQTSKPGMIVYRNSADWDNFSQIYLSLKPAQYYLIQTHSVHPWQPDTTNNGVSCYAIQVSGKDANGSSINPFLGSTNEAFLLAKCAVKSEEHTTDGYVAFKRIPTGLKDSNDYSIFEYECPFCGKVYNQEEFNQLDSVPTNNDNMNRLFRTLDNMDSGSNTIFRFVMQHAENAGYWGDLAVYETDIYGNILSNNILINSDFSLGFTGWTSRPSDTLNFRVVEQPDNFFENYKKNGEKMIVSNGTDKNALLGQSIAVERGKTYYFSGFYISMNAAGIEPKVMYKTVNGDYAAAPLQIFYDPNRYFFETTFTLPDDAYSVRGKTTVDFVIDNGNKGKAYASDLAVYEEGKYENLFKNADFKNGMTSWKTNANYSIVPYDASAFVFHYDDKAFDDGNWSNEGTEAAVPNGSVLGAVLKGNGDPYKGITMMLKPGNLKAVTDKEGIYRFNDLKPGKYSLSLRAPDKTVMFITDVEVKSGLVSEVSDITLSLEEEISFDLDTSDREPEYIEADYGIVRGYLFDIDATLLANTKIYLGKIAETKTNGKGMFEFGEVPPGKYDIYIKDKDGTIQILKTVEVLAGKGSVYKLQVPFDEESGNLWLIIGLAGAGVLLLAAGGVTALLIRKKKRIKQFNL